MPFFLFPDDCNDQQNITREELVQLIATFDNETLESIVNRNSHYSVEYVEDDRFKLI